MEVIVLFTLFESQLFPHSIFLEDQYNPASYYQDGFEINIETGTRFGLSELRTYTIHSKIKSYGISAISFGNDIYRENVVCANLSFRIVQGLSAGFGITMLNYRIKDHCNRFGYALKIGGLYQTKPIEIGGWINNINIPKFSNIDYIPPNYSLRFKYLTLNNLSFIFAIRGIETDLPFFNVGISYSPTSIITFGTGINTDPMYLEYILQLNLRTFALRYAGSNQQHLGLSHFLSVIFNP